MSTSGLIDTRGSWSGGGLSHLALAENAVEQDPRLQRLIGRVVVVPRNVPTERPTLPYILVPQNAWPWSGPTSGARERLKVTLLRLGSEVAMARSLATIRLSPAIPQRSKSLHGYLPNVLDEAFEEDIRAIGATDPPFSRPTMVAIGSLNTYRGFRSLLRAFARYRAEGGQVDLLVAGAGRAAYAADLSRLAAETPGATFINERVKRATGLSWLAAAAATVHPSHVEASSVSLLESLALNGTVIATDLPGNRGVVPPDDSGPLWYRDYDESALVASLHAVEPDHRPGRSYLATPEGRREQRELWRERFTALVLEAAG